VREPSGIRIEFAFVPRVERPRCGQKLRLRHRAAVRFGAIAWSYYRRRSSMRLRVSKSCDDWMDPMAAVEHATKPKDEVNADLLVIAAGM
jgi:hypothetical protein